MAQWFSGTSNRVGCTLYNELFEFEIKLTHLHTVEMQIVAS